MENHKDLDTNKIPMPILGSSTPIEDAEGLVGMYDAQGNLIEVPAQATTYIEVLDALSEGPIQGLVEGTYDYHGTEGNTGWTKAVYSAYDDAPNLSGVKWLRSVYWDEVPVINSENQYNFQQVDMSYVVGNADGALDSNGLLLGLKNPELRISKQINKRLYGSAGDRVTSTTVNAESDYTVIHRIHNIHAKGCIVNIRTNQLYRSINTADDPDYPVGSVVKTKVDYKIYYKPFFINQEKNPKNYTFGSQDVIEGKITDGIIKSTRVNFYSDNLEDPDFRGWEIAIVRQTPESTTIAIRNATFVDSITEVYQDGYLYPNTAIVRSKYSAEFFSNIPQRSFHVKGIKVKVPSNYNTLLRTYGQAQGGLIGGAGYDGDIGSGRTASEGGDETVNGTTATWDGTFKTNKEFTNNPAWIFYDLVTNPIYGLGQHISSANIDKFTLYEISQYCDELVRSRYGELEPRFTCNLILTTREDAIKVLQNLASIFRGLLFYKSGSIYATYDRPLVGSPMMTFNNSNVLNGEFVYQSSSQTSRHSIAIVRFNDKDNFYKPTLEIVEVPEAIKRNGIREKEIAAFGCTSRGQARRLGLWSILTDTFNSEQVSFTAGLEGAYVQPGDIVAIGDKYKKLTRTTGRTLGVYGGDYTEDSYGIFHLTDGGGVTKTANDEGKVGGCVTLSSANLYVAGNMTHNPYDNSFSIGAWFYYTGAGVQSIFCKKEASAEGYDLFVNGTTKRVVFDVEDSNGDTATVTANTFGDVNASTWYFVVASIDRVNNKIRIQVNGSHIDEATLTNFNIINANTVAKIGNNAGGTQGFAGKIDQVCLWSGRYINSGESYDMYNNGSGMSIAEMGYNCRQMSSCYELQDGPTIALDDAITYIDAGGSYKVSLLTPSYNYYSDVSDLDSSDVSNIQRSQIQVIDFEGVEHQIRSSKSHLFLETQLNRTDYNTTGSLVYTIEKNGTYTTGDTANFVNPSYDYYKVLKISSQENGTQYNISCVEYDPEKFNLIDFKTAAERENSTIDVDPEPPLIGRVSAIQKNPPNTPNKPIPKDRPAPYLPPPPDPEIEDTGDFTNPNPVADELNPTPSG